MTSSIPIPPRPTRSSDPQTHLGQSLPTHSHTTFHNRSTHTPPPPTLTVQDDLATISWPPRPSVELVSRAARKWQSGRLKSSAATSSRSPSFDPWDFSEVVTATDQVRTAFQRGSARAERPPREGVCGTYFIRRNESKGDVLCVFKPVDEEPADIEMSPSFIPHSPGLFTSGDLSLAPASPPPHPSPPFPRGGSVSSESDFDSRGYRASGFHAGEGAYKEVAAFLLDHDRFARVPQTVLAKCNFSSDVPEKNVLEANSFEDPDDHFSSFGDEPSSDTSASDDFANGAQSHHDSLLNEEHLRTKMGAFQVYVANEGDADDFGPGVFDKDQVHRIAILDIRTLNHDRHGGNILVTRSSSQERKYDLVPIDHGYILPEVIQSVPWPVWMDWPMVREPVSDRVRTYIEHLDSDSESHILHEELEGNLRPGSLQALKVATTLLQKGIKAGLSLYDIGLLMYTRREDPYTKSQLEKIIIEAEEAALARDRHLAEEAMKSSPGMPEDHCHRRHQSMSAINTEEMYVDDYIVKYARRSIQDVVSLVAERKENERVKSFSSKKAPPPMLFRARSIPDFGIGIKPLHALLTRPQPSGSVPVNTPCGSPVINGTRNASSSSCLESQLPKMTQVAPPRAAPIKIAINDGRIRRIAIPEPRTSTATETGQFGEVGVAGVIANGISNGTVDGGKVSSVNLPPRCKTTPRKSSPVAPLDMLVWETGSS